LNAVNKSMQGKNEHILTCTNTVGSQNKKENNVEIF
jgi:hypothetical protein